MTPPDLPGLSPATMRLLWALVEGYQGEPMRAVSLVTDVDSKTVGRAAKRLEFWGMARRHCRGRGRGTRGVWLEPTFLGRRIIERAAEQPMSAAMAAR